MLTSDYSGRLGKLAAEAAVAGVRSSYCPGVAASLTGGPVEGG